MYKMVYFIQYTLTKVTERFNRSNRKQSRAIGSQSILISISLRKYSDTLCNVSLQLSDLDRFKITTIIKVFM